MIVMKENWYVLFVLVAKEKKLCSVLTKKGLNAFIPQMEYYRRDIKGNALKSLFPGYIFIKSEMNQSDFDNFLSIFALYFLAAAIVPLLAKDLEEIKSTGVVFPSPNI